MEIWEDFIAGVRKNKADLLEEYGGIDGLRKHMDDERSLLEKQGWKFTTLEEVLARKLEPVPNV